MPKRKQETRTPDVKQPAVKKTRAAKPSHNKTAPKSGGKRSAVVPPSDWRSTYDLIVELRADRTAVVDTMGSEAIAAETKASADTANYQTLVSLMLSSQTKDTVNAATMTRLRAHGLTVDNILDRTSDAELFELIKAVGFNKTKVGYIRQATQVLRDKHDGKVPDTMAELTLLVTILDIHYLYTLMRNY